MLVLALTTPVSADTKKGRGTVKKPFVVTWLGEGPTQITVQVKQGKLPLLIVIGEKIEDLTWCVSVWPLDPRPNHPMRLQRAVRLLRSGGWPHIRFGQLRGHRYLGSDWREPSGRAGGPGRSRPRDIPTLRHNALTCPAVRTTFYLSNSVLTMGC